jgi:tetratricopeptide (TPR) repeat protein
MEPLTSWQKFKKAWNKFFSLGIEHPLKIILSLHTTFILATLIGLGGILGYSLNLEYFACKLMYMLLLVALASFISGFFLGFLFGIPRKSEDKDAKYQPSSHLTEIADWLTKIIIGLGLVEIKDIPKSLWSVGLLIQDATQTEGSVRVFSVCLIIYFSVFGVYFGYNFTRLYLSIQYKKADEDLLNKTKYEEAKKALEQVEMELKMDPGQSLIDESVLQKLGKFENLLRKAKPEEEYSFTDWYYRGLHAFHSNDFLNAVSYMKEAIRTDPGNKLAVYALHYTGVSYKKLGLYNEAIRVYDSITRSHVDFEGMYRVYSDIGVAKTGQEKWDEAIMSFNKSIALKPDNGLSYFNLACLFSLKGDRDKMLQNLGNAINIDKNLRARAVADEDFGKYVDDPDFMALVKA